ncbi:hypothetical protein [Diaphorobacter aerolatus]|uniref:Uncharacterized protein n=1 Tax=Diaphorobacter aerolatus TaxID=1288495 RepID=A0A7H0GJB7_9BURK|nr:hypothetical protein [Diaphorobacter aerolatus]QNP48383.1 hypothetical protein H9K75_20910 [Diaphorobacter aerolatus]
MNNNKLKGIPEKNEFDNLSTNECVTKWFNFWNDNLPVKDLKLEMPNEDIPQGGYADTEKKTTVVNVVNIDKKYWTGYHVTRHEHAHQLLKEHGYSVHHSLHFVLLDGALNYALSLSEGTKYRAEFFIRYYDFHQDTESRSRINTRLIHLLTKRLARYVNDPALLVQKAYDYSDYIRCSIPRATLAWDTKRKILEERHQANMDRILNTWTNVQAQFEEHSSQLSTVLKEKEQALETIIEDRDHILLTGKALSKKFKSLKNQFMWFQIGALAYFVGSLAWIVR